MADGRISAWTWGWSIASFVCLAALLPWWAWCNYSLSHEDPAHWLAGLAWLGLALLGSGAAALVGAVCGGVALLGGRPRSPAVVAFALNLVVFLASAGVLLLPFMPH
jgi:hypothetical protein